MCLCILCVKGYFSYVSHLITLRKRKRQIKIRNVKNMKTMLIALDEPVWNERGGDLICKLYTRVFHIKNHRKSSYRLFTFDDNKNIQPPSLFVIIHNIFEVRL